MVRNILLISSSFEEVSLITASKNIKQGVKTNSDSHYPLGIAYLHSYLESCGNNVRSLFLNNSGYEDCFKSVVSAIKEFNPSIVGLQILTPNRVSSYRIIEYIHEMYSNTQIVVGGIHTTIMYRQLLDKYPFLIAVLGEGEITFGELAENLYSKERSLNSIAGIAYSHNNAISVTKARDLISNLDVLPFPKHELFMHDNKSLACILTSRGCPFACSFCSLDSISRRRVRYRSISNVISEIEYLINKFPHIRTIWIHDDTLFLDNKRVIDFCEEVIKRKLDIEFTASGRIKPLSKKLVNKLEEANFTTVLLGLESGSDAILKAAHKEITKKDAMNAFNLFSESSIDLHLFLIVGLPGETLDTVMETVKFMQQLQRIKYTHYRNIAAILTVYPGTEIYDIAKANGVLDDEFWLSNDPSPIFTVENSMEQLLAFKEIYLNYLSLDKFITMKGFKAQFRMIPYILAYIVRYRIISKNIFEEFFYRLMKYLLPEKVYEIVVKPYRYLKQK